MPCSRHETSNSLAASSFVEDRKGDQQNLTYGSLDRRAIPRYHTAGRSHLLGLGPNFRITSRTESRLRVEDVAVDSTRKSHKQQSLLSSIAKDDQATKFHLSARKERDLSENFLKFEDERPRKRRRLLGDHSRKPDEDDASDQSDSSIEDAATIADAFVAFKQDLTRQKHLELLRATKDCPQNASAWLALVDFQHRLSEDNGGSVSLRSVTDLKISIYEQAISYVKDRDSRHALILGLMREGRAVWDANKQTSKWKTFLDDDASFHLWKLYVDFLQTSPANFSFENCLQIYEKWLLKFRDSPPGFPRDSSCIYILLRVTLLFWQAGFTERAVGIWQALLEWNYFLPQHLQAEKYVPSFQEFWASEVARIGEDGSRGWGSHTNPGLKPSFDPSFEAEGMGLEHWAAVETELSKTAGLPARSLDEVSEDDPYRVVLFSDIQEFLFRPSSEEGRQLLVDAFLLFAGLPPVSPFKEARAWTSDPFVSTQSPFGVSSPQPMNPAGGSCGISVRYEEVFLATKRLNHQVPELLRPLVGRLLNGYPQFVRRLVFQLAELSKQGYMIEGMMEYAIAFEAGTELTSARKHAKSFLKSKSDSLKLYNAYGLLELQLANFESAERVWSTALSMRLSFDVHAHMDAPILWRNWTYARMCWGQFEKATTSISMMAEQDVSGSAIDLEKLNIDKMTYSPLSAAAQIRFEQRLKLQIDIAISKHCNELLRALADLLAFHKYLNHGMRLEIALQSYKDALKLFEGRLENQLGLVEAIHEQRARFIYAHAVTFRKDFKPREANTLLSESVKQFPDNLSLLLLHHYFSQRAGVIDRLRQAESKVWQQQRSDSDASLITCLFDVLVELNRPAYSGSTNHSIRSAFERATEVGSPGHDNEEMWKAFVLWEVSVIAARSGLKSAGRNNVKDKAKEHEQRPPVTQAFYASLRACPWSKELCMLAFSQTGLKDALGGETLKQVYHNMTDRGMRLRTDIFDSLL